MKVILAILTTLAGLFLAFTHSIESPISVGQSNILKYVIALNLIWFIPYLCFYIYKQDIKKITSCFILYCMVLLPTLFFKFYRKPFNSEKWKTQFNYKKMYDKYPAHENGGMIQNIIESNMLIGLSKTEILDKLGTNYFTKNEDSEEKLFFFYSSYTIFDGCDKLIVTLKNGICTTAGYGGCD